MHGARGQGYRPGMSELEGSPFYEEAKSKRPPPTPARPETEGVPAEEDLDDADVEERLEEKPEEATNRRDVPPTPQNSVDERTEDD